MNAAVKLPQAGLLLPTLLLLTLSAAAAATEPDKAPETDSAAAAPPDRSVPGTAILPGTPAELPPSPSMLDDPRVLSPFLPRAPRGADALDEFTADTGDEPLWVLPQSAIPTEGAGMPGSQPVRELGYLDRPETIHLAGRSDAEAEEARLHRGLDWNYCGPRPARLGLSETPPEPPPGTPLDIDAGTLAYDRDTQILELHEGVDLRQGSNRVTARDVRYNRITADLTTGGETYLQYPGLRILGRSAELNLRDDTGRIQNPRYRFTGAANLRGTADTAQLIDPKLTRYTDIIYTSCRPGDDAWSLRAGKLDLDQRAGRGIARNARLRIKGVPVLYTPYLSFPIDDRRKSGLLVPSAGTSDENGFELIVPYYWNIAPNLDATFYPRYMSRRGLMIGGEFRWLTQQDEGTIQAEVIDDAESDEGLRGALRVEQNGRYFERWRTRVDYSAVSDDEYLDFGNNLDASSTRWLRQVGEISYSGTGWSLLSRVDAFQTLDPGLRPQSRPYGRLPQVLFTLPSRDLGKGLVGGLQAEYDYFDHNHLVHGQRLSLLPALSWPARRSYGHLIPSARLHAAGYSLVDTDPGQDSGPTHLIPTFDVDGRLVFEREIDWLGASALQTLEPRAFYLYTPYRDQSDTPVFDSAELTFSFANLFRSNRFTGRDRIGDANQLTAALTSRTLRARTGEELFRISIGQVYYFANRRVQIQGPVETAATSPYAGELAARLLENWHGRASFEWDPQREDDPWGRRTLQLQYRAPDTERLLNLAYRFDRGINENSRYEDTDLSFRLPVGERVRLVGRWLYSTLESETMEAFAGIEFGRCCWKLRVLGRHFKNRPDSPGSNSVMVQLELAGLGAIGSSVDTFLEDEIYGY